MAIIVEGRSICKICNKPMYATEGLVSFPPFTNDVASELYLFNDSGFHKSCFMDHPLRETVILAINNGNN